jgi:hypothetical protein
VFFDFVAVALEGERISSKPNSALYRLVDETFKELRETLEQHLKGVEKLENALKKQFST